MTTVLERSGRSVEISRSDKKLFPEDGITKQDLARYYERVGELMLPHLRDRALTMHRYPDGIQNDGFFQKDAPNHFPDWIERHTLAKDDGEVRHVIVSDVATLIYLADQGCITPHVALSRIDRPEYPDRMIFDVDPPDESGDVGMVRESVRRVTELLNDIGLDAVLMTTGSRGYHILVPLDRSSHFDRVRDLAHDIGLVAADRHPDLLTVAQRKTDRGDRVFVDYLRNAYGQTTVAPYGVRAIPGAPVATPLDWNELAGSVPQGYTMGNIFRRLAQKSDPWAGLDDRSGQSLRRVRERVDEMRPSSEEASHDRRP